MRLVVDTSVLVGRIDELLQVDDRRPCIWAMKLR